MKKCPYCAEEIQDEAIKCKHCGETLIMQNVVFQVIENICPKCSKKYDESWKVCLDCGVALIQKNETVSRQSLPEKNIPCKYCSKGIMTEHIKNEHDASTGGGCILLGIGLIWYCYSSIRSAGIDNPFMRQVYLQGFLDIYPHIRLFLIGGVLLLIVGGVLSIICTKEIAGWKCAYCGYFLKKDT